ncbi:hypothetical protein Dimus_024378 [Dionaea muscipula]
MFEATCKEFYKNFTVSISKKKEVARSSVKGVKIELDGIILASILGVPGNNGILPSHELPYGDWLTRVFKAYHLKREQGLWWLGLGANRSRDEDEAPAENVQNKEVGNEGQNNQGDFDLVQVEEETELQEEEQAEKEAEVEDSGSGEKFFDAMDDVEDPTGVTAPVPNVIAPAPTVPDMLVPVPDQQKGKIAAGVDPSGPSGSILDFNLLHLQAEFDRALHRNTRFQELYQELQSKPPTSPKP